MPYRNGQQEMCSHLQPINVKLYISLHPDTMTRDPTQSGSITHSCQLRNQQIPWVVVGFAPLLQGAHHCTKALVQGGSQSHLIGCTLEVWGDRDTLLMMYRTIVRSKLDYGCAVYGTASNTNLRQLHSIHNAGLRLALGAFWTSPLSSMYTEANEAPLEERQLKLSMNYYLKTSACTVNPAHHALHEFDQTTRDMYLPRRNGTGGMTQPPAQPIGLKVEEPMTSTKIDVETVCPLKTPTFPPGTHEYDPKRQSLSEGVSKYMITRRRGSGQIQRVSRCWRTTWWSLHWRI